MNKDSTSEMNNEPEAFSKEEVHPLTDIEKVYIQRIMESICKIRNCDSYHVLEDAPFSWSFFEKKIIPTNCVFDLYKAKTTEDMATWVLAYYDKLWDVSSNFENAYTSKRDAELDSDQNYYQKYHQIWKYEAWWCGSFDFRTLRELCLNEMGYMFKFLNHYITFFLVPDFLAYGKGHESGETYVRAC